MPRTIQSPIMAQEILIVWDVHSGIPPLPNEYAYPVTGSRMYFYRQILLFQCSPILPEIESMPLPYRATTVPSLWGSH